jgi:hypothetical protein
LYVLIDSGPPMISQATVSALIPFLEAYNLLSDIFIFGSKDLPNIFILQQSIKLTQGNSKIDPSEARISWLCHDSSIFAWVKLLEFFLKRYAQL